MSLIITAGLISALMTAPQSVPAHATLSQSTLKQQAVSMCSQAATDVYGEDAIVGVRQHVEWQRSPSRLAWHNGLNAKVRMVLRVDEQTLARVECGVDQRAQISLSTLTTTAQDSHELFANTQQ
ncbi:hypothetical protein LJ739_16025 [Aestuariibacter halophilus]|uniref:Uncharacterized protein n=1 Tax=Fluctibacter halophilus TaxID=226011 RepID=A0ABS8GEY8_9ALTE|nr:hypothetical protein [Aestuariibacter halophilus]MCC2617761.1 hypothetical protein [Aestuariibacter halophilus]